MDGEEKGGRRCVVFVELLCIILFGCCVSQRMALKLLLVEGKQLLEVTDPVFCQVKSPVTLFLVTYPRR
jgi:hypothetical protein